MGYSVSDARSAVDFAQALRYQGSAPKTHGKELPHGGDRDDNLHQLQPQGP